MLRLVVVVSVFAVLYSRSASAALCGSDPPRACLTGEAFCNADGICQCNSGSKGNGYLSCYSPKERECHLTNDPTLTTFRSQHVEFPTPCRYQAVRYTVKDTTGLLGPFKCRVMISGFNERSQGRIYVRGFDIRLEYFEGGVTKTSFYIRARGAVVGNAYEFERELKAPTSAVWETFNDDIDDLNFLPAGFDVDFKTDNVDKRVELAIDYCGLKVNYRPANDSEGIDQTYVPGLSMIVDYTNNDIKWGTPTRNVMCLDPTRHTVERVARHYDLPVEQAILYSSFVNSGHQIFPGASPECLDVKRVAQHCTDSEARKEAFRVCYFVLGSRKFVKCWEGNNSSTDSFIILELFKTCLDAFCNRDKAECEAIKIQIQNHECHVQADNALLQHSCNL